MKMPDFSSGTVILIDKPLEWTSFGVVKKIRNHYQIKKIGHAGTLDPLASGLLILCTGKFTKNISSIQEKEKEYIAEIYLGATTPSYDRETAITPTGPIPSTIDEEIVSHTLKQFTGRIQQKPPIYSALKKEGKKLYEYARNGQHVEIPTREVHITTIEILDFTLPIITIKVICSKGTYIRSLAHDIGTKLNTGAYLYNLKRTRIGPYLLKDAYSISDYLTLYDK